MKILFLADVVGKSGRMVVKTNLEKLKTQFAIDAVIINGENSAHGKGITKKIYDEFCELGADVITMGNHTFSKGAIYDFIADADRLVIPANLASFDAGQNYKILDRCGIRFAVINLCGEVWMNNIVCNPFDAMKQLMQRIPSVDGYFVDFHAEATSEKIIFANVFKKDCIAVIGTHTHVQTADERIMDGCAFISDAGMCGAYDSVLGRDTDEMIRRQVFHEATHYQVAKGAGMLCGVVVEIDEQSKRAVSIERIQIRPKQGQE